MERVGAMVKESLGKNSMDRKKSSLARVEKARARVVRITDPRKDHITEGLLSHA